ncbi:MAG: creatininase family protein [Gemmatimonadota bacterium]|nr:creatininase family protein [Gemmatimonadota bacterium]
MNRNEPAAPTRLERLAWPAVVEHLRSSPRLLMAVGSCVQHGPHLPLGTDTLIAERLAEDVAARTGLLLAPTFSFGVTSRRDREFAGTAALDRKTLHRVLNEFVESWERHGLQEIVFLTANGHPRHIQALAMVVAERVRVRSIDLHAFDLRQFLSGASRPDHGGELETSLMLHLAPDLVRCEAIPAADEPEQGAARRRPGPLGAGGRPWLASAEKGRRIHAHLVETITRRLAG